MSRLPSPRSQRLLFTPYLPRALLEKVFVQILNLKMASRSNPNTPAKSRRKTAGVLKSKRKHLQRLATADKNRKISKQSVPRTSQALRQAAPLSRKKARKLDKKGGYTKQREDLEKFLETEVEMRDFNGKTVKAKDEQNRAEEEKMQID